MSHLHIPDGILSQWLWVLGYVITGIYFTFLYFHMKKKSENKKISIISVLGALMLLSMSIPIPFALPYHLNLSALLGILVGPLYAGVAIFSVNLILALVGHGGITIIGLNTIVLTAEAAAAYFLFSLFKKHIKKIFLTAFISTFMALVLSTFLNIGIVYTGTHNINYVIHKHNHEHVQEHNLEKNTTEKKKAPIKQTESFDIKRFTLLVIITGLMGWTLESFITAFIVKYINRVKPELIATRKESV